MVTKEYGEGLFGVRYLLENKDGKLEDVTKFFITETARDICYKKCKKDPKCSTIRKVVRK